MVYFVKKGEKAVRLEKWIFTEKVPLEDANGNPVKNVKGQIVYEERLLERPKCRLFSVFNGEQVSDFPKYEPEIVPEGEIEKRIEALLSSSECPIHQVAQDRSFYSYSIDEIVLPLMTSTFGSDGYTESIKEK